MKYDYDIAIIGSGISGAMLGAILAKNDLRVIILDAGTHPRFAVGESMIPESGILVQLLARRYGIPELSYPGELNRLMKHIGTSSAGIKLAFSFAWNGKGREHDPSDLVSTPVLAPEAHLFRQDVDAYYVALAVKLGATIKQMARIKDIDADDGGVSLGLVSGESYRVRYVVDAAGYRSPVADRFKMRENAPPMQCNLRSLFTHFVGVKLYEEAIAGPETHGSPTHLAQSTLHHIFGRGWLWIIPFNNQPFSTNPLCSVGLQLDIGRHGPAKDPETEFRQFLRDYPSAARHFEGAARVREWTVAPHLNYNSRYAVGDRYCLLGHAAGFVDPLFSRGLSITFESLNRVAPKILRAAKEDRWRKEDFASYQTYIGEVVRINDRLVANSYRAFESFPLWNAWFRVWLSGSYIGVLRLRKILADYVASGNDEALDRAFEEATYAGHLSIESHKFEALFESAATTLESFDAGKTSEAEAIAVLQDLFSAAGEHLPLDFADFANRFVSRPTAEFAASLLNWANNAPDGLRDKFARGPTAPGFDFQDQFRYGSRLDLIAQADAKLAEQRQRMGSETTAPAQQIRMPELAEQ